MLCTCSSMPPVEAPHDGADCLCHSLQCRSQDSAGKQGVGLGTGMGSPSFTVESWDLHGMEQQRQPAPSHGASQSGAELHMRHMEPPHDRGGPFRLCSLLPLQQWPEPCATGQQRLRRPQVPRASPPLAAAARTCAHTSPSHPHPPHSCSILPLPPWAWDPCCCKPQSCALCSCPVAAPPTLAASLSAAQVNKMLERLIRSPATASVAIATLPGSCVVAGLCSSAHKGGSKTCGLGWFQLVGGHLQAG